MAERKNNDRNNNSLSKRFFNRITGYDKEVKEGKGVKKRKITDKERYSLKSFFAVYKNQFWNLIFLNLIFMLMVSPIIGGMLAYTGVFGDRVQTPSNILYAPVYGAHLCFPTPATANLIGIYGAQSVVVTNSAVSVALMYLTLIVFLTFGLANAGMTYILRAYTRSEFAYLWYDFFNTIKKNFIGAMILGIADLAIIILLIYSGLSYYTAAPDFTYTVLFFITFSTGVIYFIMRFYLYILLITFKLSPVKLIKNAFILALLGIKRNCMAIIGIGIFCLIGILIFWLSIPLGLTLPFFFLVAHCSFISCFAAYPNVKKYMIDPYYTANPKKDKDKLVIEEEPVFIDRG
jgi:uncharacterized membrane protein YesL